MVFFLQIPMEIILKIGYHIERHMYKCEKGDCDYESLQRNERR